MMRPSFITGAALLLAACTPVPQPIVDMTGVDQAQYNKDLAACYDAIPGFSFGNPVAKCMAEKGYKVLVAF